MFKEFGTRGVVGRKRFLSSCKVLQAECVWSAAQAYSRRENVIEDSPAMPSHLRTTAWTT